MKKFYSIQEIIELGLSSLPSTHPALNRRAKLESWLWKEIKAKGGKNGVRKEYILPDYALAELVSKKQDEYSKQLEIKGENTDVANVVPTVSPELLADWQRDCGTARLAIVRHVLDMADLLGKTKAVEKFAADSKNGQLTATLADTVRRANAKAGKDGNAKVSRATLFNWLKLAENAGDNSLVAVLAPKHRDVTMPVWGATLLKLWGQPTKPSLSMVMRELVNVMGGENVPSYAQASYFLRTHVGNVELERGRMGARELKNIQPFIRRDTSELFPTDVYTADGHTFDAEVAHPISGRPFRPEITAIIDVASRKLVGFSIDLAESGLAVLDAIRVAVVWHGVMALFYVDNGSGYKNAMMSRDGSGLMDRLGSTLTHSLPYNSQAKGVVERSHQSIWIQAAKRLPTYIGVDMDKEARQKVFKKTRKDIATFGESKLLLAWDDFMTLCRDEVERYNNRPHHAHPRRHNKLTGRREHLTPQQVWDEKLAMMANMGKPVVQVREADMVDLFRPYIERKVLRGEIKMFNHVYFSRELEQYHGETVHVGYDIHDASQVWVRDVSGRLLAVAKFEANTRAYFAQPVIEQAHEKRALGQLKRVKVRENEILETLSPSRVLEHIDTMRLPQAQIDKAFATLQSTIEAQAIEVTAASTLPPRYPVPDNAIDDGTPDMKILDETDDERFERWLALDSRVQGGEVLVGREYDFWELFAMSKTWRIKMAQHDKEQEIEEEIAKLLSK
nr:transposase family protein [Moraxella osloensis]